MHELLLKLVLGPVLLGQGWYTRRVTPRLPEAVGERSGSQGEGVPLKLLVAGDSAAAGVGVATQSEALMGQLVERLSAECVLSWKLIARSGLDTPQLTRLLESHAPDNFDVVVISVGVNDVTGGGSASDWRDAMERLLDLLRGRFAVRQLVLLRVPPMHAFTGLPQPLRWYLGWRARRFNQQLSELVAEHSDCSLSEEMVLAGQLMAEDGFHPSATIYAQWAAMVAGLLCRSMNDPELPTNASTRLERSAWQD